jgi:hypothetical protein
VDGSDEGLVSATAAAGSSRVAAVCGLRHQQRPHCRGCKGCRARPAARAATAGAVSACS